MSMMRMSHGGAPEQTSLKPGTVKRTLGFAAQYKGKLVLFLLLSVVSAVLGVASPVLAGDVVNAITGDGNADLVVRLALLIALVAVLDAALSVFTKWLSSGLGERVIYDLRTAVFDHVQRMPVAFFQRTRTGALVSRLNNDVIGAQSAISRTLSGVVANVVSVALTLGVMVATSWQVTVLSLVMLPLFLLPALTRRSWPGGAELAASARLRDDPELRMAAGLVLLVTLVLFARPFVGAFSDTAQPVSTPAPAADTLTGGLARAAAAAWGSAFTALSFLTTTGWTSIDWDGARAWAGLSAPGLMLAGLAIMGGGIATTAGGVKLLRVFALGLHARRELEKIVHPASIGGGGPIIRRLRGSGAYLAFVFFMVFALSIAAVIALVSLRPVAFETATMLSVAALTNTGQLAEAIPLIPAFQGSAGTAGAPWAGWAGLSAGGKAVLAAAMVAGRLETLAILALLSPGAWRR